MAQSDRFAADSTAIDWTAAQIPARIERLSNGLMVAAHQDRKSPIAAVFIGYRAGSRDEPAAKAGLAHVCEHLMFSGTPTAPGSYFAPFEAAGAAWMNAYVREDYSAYFETVPSGALDFALRMEADRMVNLADALDAKKLELQREVVRNELHQREGEPFGSVTRILAEAAHPPSHPYSHPPDGLAADLDNITPDDVREWLATRHCPANAAIVIAGAIEPNQAIDTVRRHFGAIAPGRPPVRRAAPVMRATGAARRTETASGQTGICMAWHGPPLASHEYPAIELACELIAGSAGALLPRQLVMEDRLATKVEIEMRPREFGSLIVLRIANKTGAPVDTIEAAARERVAELGRRGVSAEELAIARVRRFGKLVHGVERVGGPQSKSDLLGLAMLAGGGAEVHERRIRAIAAATPNTVAEAALRWFTSDCVSVEMRA
ncbi:MAG TPA: pitrilysin family protein, partial [Candidatus Binataceae bacterium]|nr:pitrilysin family protein [Candidatus Binataceae bacterium]